ncbi:MAG: GGDEF domain-containing protein [Gammaproteobacteria bacterium]
MKDDSKHKDEVSLLEGHGTNKVLDLLENLKNSQAGNIIFQQIEHVLRASDHTQDKIIRGYAAVAQVLINAYRKSLPKNSMLYFELKLIQKRLNPPITISELAVLHGYLHKATKLINEVAELDNDAFNDVFSPFLSANFADNSMLETRSDENATENSEQDSTSLSTNNGNMPKHIEQSIDSLYRSKLTQHHKEILSIQGSLTDKISATLKQQKTFANKLQSVLKQLEDPQSQRRPETLRASLMNEVETILIEQGKLTQMMHDTQSFLGLIGSNVSKLSDELDQVRVLSLTDELTQLPNRRAFLRRIKDEMGRAQRDKTLLTIAMIDLDDFKVINDKYGHAIGDEMLRVYAREVLSIFRRYDMVARYGGEEFAVILPNTDKQGSQYAFKKIRDKVGETFIINNNEAIPIPTFSAGLAIYEPGESVESLLERADNAMYTAKQSGRDRIEYNQKYLGNIEEFGQHQS